MVVLEAVVAWGAIVILTMLVVAYLAARWGRDPFGWLLLSAVMGPIALVGLIGTRHSDLERAAAPEQTRKRGEGEHCVLVAVDGSSGSEAAVRHAIEMRDEFTDAIVLAVLPHEAKPATAGRGEDEYNARVERMTAPAVAALREAGMAHRVAVAFGSAGEEIVRAAEREGADAIVVGRRGAGLTRALLGSTSDHVVRHAKQPVTVIG
jgi:nucleotide-binding universal stress UspA family protein